MKAIETHYNGLRFRSRIEARWAVFFDTLGIAYQYEEKGFDLGDGILYLPDFWLPEHEVWAEIKGDGPISDEEKGKIEALARESRYPALIFQGSFTSNEEYSWGIPLAFDCWCYNEWDQDGVVTQYFDNVGVGGNTGSWGWCKKCKKASLQILDCRSGCGVVWPDGSRRTYTCGCGRDEVVSYHKSEVIHKAYLAARRVRFEFGESAERLANLLCPQCGAKMVLKKPGLGQNWSPFYGCSRYPRCKGHRPA